MAEPEGPGLATPMSDEGGVQPSEKQRILAGLSEKGIVDYAPNVLDSLDQEALLSAIATKLHSADSPSQEESLMELQGFVGETGGIFPEFSHGTSSDTAYSIFLNGLFPAAMAKSFFVAQHEYAQSPGEHYRGGRAFRGDMWHISAAAGQGGLGTALAYAQILENPLWNPNVLSEDELQRALTEERAVAASMTTTHEGERMVVHSRVEALQIALARREHGIAPDFPLLLGFNRTDNASSITDLRINNFAIAKIEGGEGKKRYSMIPRPDGALDSEVAFGAMDVARSRDIPVVAVPRQKREEFQAMMTQLNRPAPRVLSIEAVRELPGLGYGRIQRAFDGTTALLQNNLTVLSQAGRN